MKLDGDAPALFDRGTPGRSAHAEYQRRLARDEARRKEQYGRLAWLATLIGGERQSTRAWSTGADGERRVATALDRAIGDRGILLHDRRVPGTFGNIDHIAVVPSGVWVVDAKEYRGRVQCHVAGGGWLGNDAGFYVGGRDRSKALDGVRRQRDAVGRMLRRDFGEDAPSLHAAICLVGAEWGLFSRPLHLGGVWVAWPSRLGRMLLESPATVDQRIERTAAVLARRFPVR